MAGIYAWSDFFKIIFVYVMLLFSEKKVHHCKTCQPHQGADTNIQRHDFLIFLKILEELSNSLEITTPYGLIHILTTLCSVLHPAVL